MNKKSGVAFFQNACRRKTYQKLLENYLCDCRSLSKEENPPPASARNPQKERFPNLAGFCRFLKIGAEDMQKLSEEFPEAFAYICATLEDEALNSSLSPTLLNSYLKQHLGYGKPANVKNRSETVRPAVRFEHDIFRDGE